MERAHRRTDPSAVRDGGGVRFALSGAGGSCDQHGPRDRPTPGAVALRRRKKRSRYSPLRHKSQ
jgi:hypothetical protein